MSIGRRAIISVLTGAGITSVGVGLAMVGKWGPCGPADTLAVVGGYMSLYQWQVLCDIVPPAQDLYAAIEPLGSDFLMLLLPVAVWSAVSFGVLTGISHFKRREKHGALQNRW